MGSFGYLVDEVRCAGCKACEIACKNRNELESPGPRLRQVSKDASGKFPDIKVSYHSLGCMHCEHPACMEVCPQGAIVKLEDGAVVGIREQCIGCQSCLLACPFDVPQYREEDGTMIKCDSCYDRRQMGMEPACAHACFYGGIHGGDLDELLASVPGAELAEVMDGETGPNVAIIARA